MHVPVLLALHRFVPKIRKQPEPPRAMLLPHPHRDLADMPHVRPKLRLRYVLLRYGEQHHRHPAQTVAEHHHLVVFVQDVRWLAALDNLAERAGVGAQLGSAPWSVPESMRVSLKLRSSQ